MLKVNDRVKIIGVNVDGSNNYIGAEGNVNSIGHIYAYVKGIKMKSGTFSSWFPTKSLEKIEPEEKEFKFKVGEQVKIIGYSNLGYDTGTVGEIGIVENVDGDNTPYWVTSKSNHTGLFYGEESLEKVEPAPEPKFKKGDRVYIKDNAINCPAGNATVDSFYLYQEKLECDAYRVINDEGDKYVALERDMTLIDNKITAENRVDYPKDDEQKKENSDSFYCCYVEGTGGFAYKHSTEDKAVKEAERLARKENRKVYVLKAIKSCEIPDSPVKWNNL